MTAPAKEMKNCGICDLNFNLVSYGDMLLRNAIYLPYGKCDISASQMRYAINSYAPQRISLREAEYRARQRISQIPPGIYIAASHKWLAKPGVSFLMLNLFPGGGMRQIRHGICGSMGVSIPKGRVFTYDAHTAFLRRTGQTAADPMAV